MAVFSGPEIVNSGLVFHYDMSNTQKSWKGKPATNLVGNNFFDGNENFTVDQNITDTMPDGSFGTARLLNAQFVTNLNRTVSIGSYALEAGQTYTLSFYVMNIDCTGFNGNLYSPTLLRVIGNITYPTVYTNVWTRVVTTFTVPNEGPNPVTLAPQAFRDGGNGRFKLCWLQLEQNSFATPYVSGARSNTQALLDLTNQETITAASLTYASNNTFSFDGTNNYMTIPQPNITLTPNQWSIEMILYPVSSDFIAISPNSAGIDHFVRYDGASQRINFQVTEAGDVNTRSRYSSANSVPLNKFTHIALTINDLSMKIYINGVLDSSYTETISIANWTGTWHIGQRGNGTFRMNGSLPLLKIYNRELSAVEARQNFDAIRDRYIL